MVRRFLRRYWLAIAIVLIFIAMWGGLWANRYSRVALVTAFSLPDLFFDPPLSVMKIVGEEPLRQEVYIAGPDGPIVADIYRPVDADAHGAMLIVVGAAPDPRNHPGAVRLATSLARSGVVVMIPELERIQGDVMDPRDIETVVAAFRYLRSQRYVDPQRMGIVGFSVGVGLAVAAAADQRIRYDVRFLASIGGYYDLWDVIAAATTGTIFDDGQVKTWQPRLKTIAVLERSLIHFLEDPDERNLLARHFLLDDPTAILDGGRLSPTGALVAEILSNRDPQRTQALLARVPPQELGILRQLSPKTHIEALETEFFIMHDRSDLYIPYVESRRLRDAVLSNGVGLHYAEFDIFEHVEPANWTDPLTLLANVLKLAFYSWLLLLRLI